MKHYVYVFCEVDPTNEDPPAFRHLFVLAACDEDAYDAGQNAPESEAWRTGARARKHAWNDYVIDLTTARARRARAFVLR